MAYPIFFTWKFHIQKFMFDECTSFDQMQFTGLDFSIIIIHKFNLLNLCQEGVSMNSLFY